MSETREDLVITLDAKQGDVIKVLDDTIKRVGKLEISLGKMGSGAIKTSKKFEKSLFKISNKMQKVSKGIENRLKGTVGRIIGLFGIGGLVGVIGKTISVTKNFETKLNEVSTLISGDATKSIKQYESAIRDLALNSSTSVAELTQGLYQTISAGVEGSKSVEGAMVLVDVAQKAAVAGVSNTFAAVDVLTTSLNAYGESSKSVMKFSDKLFTAVKLGKTTFNDLASQLGMVASIAASANISFDAVNAAVVAMTKGGLSTDVAVTALRATIMSIIKPSKELATIFKKHGFESGAAAIEVLDFAGVMKLLNKETGGSTEQLQKLFPNVRAMAGVSIMAGTGVDSLIEAVIEMGKSAGATDEAYKKMADTFEYRTKRFYNIINDIFLIIGKEILPVMLEQMDKISNWVNENSDKIVKFVKGLFEWIVKVGQWVINYGPTVVTTLAAMWATGKIIALGGALKNLWVLMKGWTGWLRAVSVSGGALSIFGVAMVGLSASFIALANNIKKSKEEAREYVKDMRKAFIGVDFSLFGGDARKVGKLFGLIERRIGDIENLSVDASKVVGKDLEQMSVGLSVKMEMALGYINEADKVIKSLQDKAKKGIFTKQAIQQMKDVFAQLRPGEKLLIPMNMNRRALRMIKNVLQEQENRLDSMRDRLFSKEESFIKKITTIRQEQGFKTSLEIFKLNKEHTDALLIYDKRGMIGLSKSRKQILDNLFKYEDLVRVELGKKELMMFDNYIKERKKLVKDAIKQEIEDKASALEYMKQLELASLNEKQQIIKRYQDDINTINEMSFVKSEDKERTLFLRKMKFTDTLNNLKGKDFETLSDRVEEGYQFEKELLRLRTRFGDEEEQRQSKIALLRLEAEEKINKLREDAAKFGKPMADIASVEAGIKDKLVEDIDVVSEPGWFSKIKDMGKEIGIGFLRSIGEKIEGVFTSVMSTIVGPVSEIINVAMGPLNVLLDLFKGILSGQDMSGLQGTLNNFLSFFENLANNLPQMIKWFAETAVPAIIESMKVSLPVIISALVDLLPILFDAIVQALPIIIESLMSQMPRIIFALVDGMLQVSAVLIEKLPLIIESLVRMIPNIVTAFIKNIPKIALAVGKAIADVIRRTVTGTWSSDTSWTKGEEGLLPDEIPILGKLHEGGMVKHSLITFADSVSSFMHAVRAHSGLYVKPVLQPDEVPIIAKVGEAVMNESFVKNMGGEAVINEMNRTGRTPGNNTVINNNLSVQHMFSDDSPKVIDKMLRERFRFGNVLHTNMFTNLAYSIPGFTSKR